MASDVRSKPVLLALLSAALAAPAPAAAATGDSVRARAVAWAVDQEGKRENGTTNCSAEINRWKRAMGLRVPPCRPWCGAFVHQAFLRAGVRLSARLIDPDRTYDDVAANRRGLRRIPLSQVAKGDLLLFAFRSGLKASHVAIVRGRTSGGRVLTAEGNVGHYVRLENRPLRLAVIAARVTV